MNEVGKWFADHGIRTANMTALAVGAETWCPDMTWADGAHASFNINIAKAQILGILLDTMSFVEDA